VFQICCSAVTFCCSSDLLNYGTVVLFLLEAMEQMNYDLLVDYRCCGGVVVDFVSTVLVVPLLMRFHLPLGTFDGHSPIR